MELKEFLQKLKSKGVLPSITVHQNEFVDKVNLINVKNIIHKRGDSHGY